MKKLMKYGLTLLSLFALTLVLMNGTMQSSSVAQNQDNRRVPTSDAEVKLSYAPVVREAAPAVVNIYTKRVVRTRTSPFMDDPFFSRFFGGRSTPRERIERSLGSGVIVREEGVVVTNFHVIEGADEITVALNDRREFEADVIHGDEMDTSPRSIFGWEKRNRTGIDFLHVIFIHIFQSNVLYQLVFPKQS